MGSTKTGTALAVAAMFMSSPTVATTSSGTNLWGSTASFLESIRLGVRREEKEAPVREGTAQYAEPAPTVAQASSTVPPAELIVDVQSRKTTPAEETIGEIRKWGVLAENWDGEGAKAPIPSSLMDASHFVCAIDDRFPIPTPMLHPSGRAGLYWNEHGLYADLEFLGNGQLSYFIEREGEGKHKGVVTVRKDEVPAVFEALLGT